MATRKMTLLALVSILTTGYPAHTPDPRVLRSSMASAIPKMGIVVVRDAAGHPVRFRFPPEQGVR